VSSPFPPRRKWGQNFLVDPAAARRIVEAADPRRGESVLEIGPGDGALTRPLANTGARVLAVEIDPLRGMELARELASLSNVRVVVGDALERSGAEWLEREGLPLPGVLVANLPYNVATPILTRSLSGPGLSRIVVTVQREVARRLVARPGCDDYGYLSVLTAIHATGEILFDLAPGAFRPRPKVTSSVVRLVPHEPPGNHTRDRALVEMVGRAFAKRRKTLANALAGLGGKARWEAAMAAAGLPARARAEELSLSDFRRLLAASEGAA